MKKLFVLLSTSLIAVCAMFVNVSSVNSSTIAYWRFEEGAANTTASIILDSSGNGNSGTAINGPLYSLNVPVNPIPQTRASNILSMGFNGTNQRVFIPDNPLFQLTHSLTLEANINVNAYPAGGTGPGEIVMRGDDRAGYDPYFMAVDANGNLIFAFDNSSNIRTQVSVPVPLHQWLSVAGILDDATGHVDLYVNGVLKAFTTTANHPLATLNSGDSPGLGIGNVQSSNYTTECFNGLIDEVRISNVALSPNQFLNAVPEPSTLTLLGSALLGLGVIYLRRRGADF